MTDTETTIDDSLLDESNVKVTRLPLKSVYVQKPIDKTSKNDKNERLSVEKAGAVMTVTREFDTNTRRVSLIPMRDLSDEALREAKGAYERALTAKNTSEDTTQDVLSLLDNIEKFLGEEASCPAEIKRMAEECLAPQISIKQGQIQELAQQINETIAGLTDITKILMETAGDLAKAKPDRAKARADGILGQTEEVQNALKEAEDAQKKAEAAIAKANGHIDSAATRDLGQIESETEAVAINSEKASSGIYYVDWMTKQMNELLDDMKRHLALNEINL